MNVLDMVRPIAIAALILTAILRTSPAVCWDSFALGGSKLARVHFTPRPGYTMIRRHF